MKNFGRKMRLARIEQKRSQDWLAKQVEASRGSIVRWESGEDLPSARTCALIANALDRNLLWMLGQSGIQERIMLQPDEHALLRLYRRLPLDAKVALLERAQVPGEWFQDDRRFH